MLHNGPCLQSFPVCVLRLLISVQVCGDSKGQVALVYTKRSVAPFVYCENTMSFVSFTLNTSVKTSLTLVCGNNNTPTPT